MMVQRLLFAANAGPIGHRAVRTTERNLNTRFWWQGMAKDVHTFVNSCLHFVSANSGQVVPRSLGEAVHATTPNKVLQFEIAHMGKSTGPEEYVLIMKNDFPSYVWLILVSNADAATTAECLLTWFASFCTVNTWISDQGTHFLNA